MYIQQYENQIRELENEVNEISNSNLGGNINQPDANLGGNWGWYKKLKCINKLILSFRNNN